MAPDHEGGPHDIPLITARTEGPAEAAAPIDGDVTLLVIPAEQVA